ncbi:MAG: bifunctional diaminohydroxyphosphoribosylaminopyrimidine deaminase/5-amino-6-(5-phosphoribosylamino)uracil reductase RibD [Phycisphaerae bacterium]
MSAPETDIAMMRRALALARRGLGRVEPNPMVGAVVVRDGRIVGEGYHARFGGPHAEVVALEAAGPDARGADLFVTLEPCCHHGKTPPCTEAILAAGVARLVAAVADPFPEVSGRGLARLREGGVEVTVGVLEEEARRANAAFFKRTRTGRPLVIAKWAMTLDGRLADGSGTSRWISGQASRRRVHEVRRVCEAVVVGSGTALADAPSLTVRHVDPLPERGQPTRGILDGRLRLAPDAEPAASARQVPVIVYTREAADVERGERAAALRAAGCEVVPLPAGTGGLDLGAVLDDLGRRGASRVLIEGGATVLGSLLAEGLADRVMVFIAPRLLASDDARSPLDGPAGRALADAVALRDLTVERVGEDVLIEGRVGEF